MLSRTFSISVFVGALLLAGPAAAVTTVYDMTGSSMQIFTQACTPCVTPVTGSISLDDDLAGNVLLTDMSLSHGPYEVGVPGFISVVLDRDSITLSTSPLAGTGTTVGGSVLFGSTTLSQTGTVTCTGIQVPCSLANLLEGVQPITPSVPVNLGNWAFDLVGNLSAQFIYTQTPQATEGLFLVGTVIPEPGTALLLTAGLVGMALRRRAGR